MSDPLELALKRELAGEKELELALKVASLQLDQLEEKRLARRREWLAQRDAAIRSSHEPADMETIMRPYNYEKGKHKVMLIAVDADTQTEGGIIIPGAAQLKTGECVVIDVGDNPPSDLGLCIGQRVQVAKYMGSYVELREKWVSPDGEIKLCTHHYITIDASHILNTFEPLER